MMNWILQLFGLREGLESVPFRMLPLSRQVVGVCSLAVGLLAFCLLLM